MKPIELLHWYAAMGLKEQHGGVQVLLARVRDFNLLDMLVETITSMFTIDFVDVRAANKNLKEKQNLEHIWRNTSSWPVELQSRLEVATVPDVNLAPRLMDSIHVSDFLKSLDEQNREWLDLINESQRSYNLHAEMTEHIPDIHESDVDYGGESDDPGLEWPEGIR